MQAAEIFMMILFQDSSEDSVFFVSFSACGNIPYKQNTLYT